MTIDCSIKQLPNGKYALYADWAGTFPPERMNNEEYESYAKAKKALNNLIETHNIERLC